MLAEKDYTNLKKTRWTSINSLDSNLEYIELLCKLKKIESCKEVINSSGGTDLLISHKGKHYKVIVNSDRLCLNILERNQANNKKDREYYHLIKFAGENGCFFGSDCWLDIISWIKNRDKRRNENGNFE